MTDTSNSRLAGRAALITGGGSGIGKSVCARLASEGARVFVLDLDREAAEQSAGGITDSGGQAEAVACDVTRQEAVLQAIATIEETAPLDILVNSAGVAHVGNIENTSESDFDRLYTVNVKGVYNAMFATVPRMKSRGRGTIVNIASIASSVGLEERFAYSMTKGAVLTMTYSVARDYVDSNIRCNCVSPARIHTPFVDHFLDTYYPDNRDEMFDKLSKGQPIGRMGTPEEVAGLVAYLCSDEASFVTGTDFPIDGGFIKLKN